MRAAPDDALVTVGQSAAEPARRRFSRRSTSEYRWRRSHARGYGEPIAFVVALAPGATYFPDVDGCATEIKFCKTLNTFPK
jgi:hypothetical protein